MFSKISGATAVAILAAVARAQDAYGPPAYSAPSHSEATTPAATSIAATSSAAAPPAYAPSSVESSAAASSVESSAAASSAASSAAPSVLSSTESAATSATSSAASETTPAATSKASASSEAPSSITPSATLPLSTAPNGETFVTSTVYKTSEVTILSCKPEVTDCPANTAAQTHTVLTTVTVPDYVTVCPVTASLGVPKPTTVAPYTTVGISSAPLTTFVGTSAITTPEATSKAPSTVIALSTETVVPIASVASSKPFEAGNSTMVAPTGSAPIGTGKTAAPTTEAGAPGYGVHSESKSAETTALATSKPFLSTGALSTGTSPSTEKVSSSQGPFHLQNGTVPTHGPTGPTGTAPVVLTTTAATQQKQTVTLDVGGSVITKTVEFTAYETVVETDFVTEHLTPVSTAAVATTALTTAVPVTFTDRQGQEQTSTVQITHTETLLSTIHLTKTAHITETVPGAKETTPVAVATESSVPVYYQASTPAAASTSMGSNDHVATDTPSKPSSSPVSPVNGECPACAECGEKETVTVTMPAETVYVTMGEKGTATASIVSATMPAAMTSSAPYAAHNGTMVHGSSGHMRPTGASSGFLTSTKPAAESKASSTKPVATMTSVKPTESKPAETPVGYGKRFFGF